MAKATFEALKSARPDLEPQPWEDVKAELEGFLRANTKWSKDSWFKAQGFESTDFISMTSLPDCIVPGCRPYAYRKQFEWWERIQKTPIVESTIPKQTFDLIVNFFAVVAKLSPGKYLYEFMDVTAVTAALARNLRVEEPCPDIELLILRMLVDGLFSGGGATAPEYFCEATIDLQNVKESLPPSGDGAEDASYRTISCDMAKDFIHKTLRDPPVKSAPEPDVPLGYDFDISPGRAAGTYIGVARYKHLPNQVLVAIADERPKIIEIAWMPKR